MIYLTNRPLQPAKAQQRKTKTKPTGHIRLAERRGHVSSHVAGTCVSCRKEALWASGNPEVVENGYRVTFKVPEIYGFLLKGFLGTTQCFQRVSPSLILFLNVDCSYKYN
ncbi:hypothetical protein BaRGS_00034481 [Batillaria attramentaria]|uniref:Uncharacterized protein n=1 Tax=Batillaria attramentaria TaxID=370345 RepID=A0ABD0JH72_9CAEN